ncbi:organic cation transporter protein [Lingula anatina]|uniref:Organic cation transporter protein n=1 Tax=Lingula anatina TaxID=7574 RepID=A0A1S3JT01_LINAN|nr:organic cation transporter protein [Lingula anatina]|eukprot:XP_013413256.1 organic cation transporter protein [Lingula anatina]
MGDEFEQILDKLGQFRGYQVLVFSLLQLSDVVTAWTMLLPIFISARPQWYCPNTADNSTNNNTVSVSPHIENGTLFDSMTYSDGAKDFINFTILHEMVQYKSQSLDSNMSQYYEAGGYIKGFCTSDGGICEGHTYSTDFTSVISEWNLLCSEKYIGTLITTIQMIGVLGGAIVIGQLGDTFGRKMIYFATIALNSVFGTVMAFASSWQLFAACRFMNGFCMGGLLNINYIWPMEFVGPRWRTFCGCVGLFQVGGMTLALLAYFIRDWRNLCLATSLPPLALMFTWWAIPESPRWLSMKNRFAEAEIILTKMAKWNKRPVPDFSKLRTFAETEKAKLGKMKSYSYWDLFRTPAMCKNMLIVMYAWFVCAAVFYGLNYNVKNLAGDRYLNMFLVSFIDMPAVWSTIFFNAWCGRRKTLFVSMLIAGLANFAVLFVDVAGKMEELSLLTKILALIGKFGISASWSVAYLYSAELFPTVVRNLAMGLASTTGRIGGIIAPQLVYMNNFSKPLPFIIFGCLGITSALANAFLPETRGKPLPDSVPLWKWKKSSAIKSNQDESEMPLSETGSISNGNCLLVEGNREISGSEVCPSLVEEQEPCLVEPSCTGDLDSEWVEQSH